MIAYKNVILAIKLHLSNPVATVLSFINVILFGLVFFLIFHKTNSLWGVGSIHSIWNFFQVSILGVKVSGLSIFSSVSKSIKQNKLSSIKIQNNSLNNKSVMFI